MVDVRTSPCVVCVTTDAVSASGAPEITVGVPEIVVHHGRHRLGHAIVADGDPRIRGRGRRRARELQPGCGGGSRRARHEKYRGTGERVHLASYVLCVLVVDITAASSRRTRCANSV